MHRLARWMMAALVLTAMAGAVTWALLPVWPDVGPWFTVAAAGAALWAFHTTLTYAEERGWIYYRRKRGSYGGLGTATNFLNMYDPSRKHLQEVVREGEWKREEDDDGDDPSP